VLHRWHGLSYSGLVEAVVQIVGRASKACVFFDATGVGDPVGDQLQAARVWCEPFVFTNPSKQGLMEGLALALQQGRTTVLDGAHRAELEAFEYDLRVTNGVSRVVYGAPSGAHDDTVCAHALAWYGAERLGVSNTVRRASLGAPLASTRDRTW
jgi:hypothetical protein